ncbi:hypothetical protein HQ38_09855 [Porphyromonas crevioricanis]|uniref:Uncharacterized protein n=1 Tax=Porphyromonas crevioricanis TaxID=393921 RepID=A0AB34PEY8_9PORP|nr:hypothetical protein HQ38_09855 [Porphyromonas crevioricanis]
MHPSIFDGSKRVSVIGGTYNFDGSTVIWKVDGRTIKGAVSGSIIMIGEGVAGKKLYIKGVISEQYSLSGNFPGFKI